jgi:hypothetical protein
VCALFPSLCLTRSLSLNHQQVPGHKSAIVGLGVDTTVSESVSLLRDTSNFTADWRVGPNPEPQQENAKWWPGINDVNTDDGGDGTVVDAEKRWSTSVKVPQPRLRAVAPRPARKGAQPKKKEAPWCMAMLDAQRKQGAKAKNTTKKPARAAGVRVSDSLRVDKNS